MSAEVITASMSGECMEHAGMIPKGTPQSLAREFSRLLRQQLNAEEMQEVIARNAAESHPDVCHSHDFCDANMVMHEAVENMGLAGLEFDALRPVWSAAWQIAFESKFDVV